MSSSLDKPSPVDSRGCKFNLTFAPRKDPHCRKPSHFVNNIVQEVLECSPIMIFYVLKSDIKINQMSEKSN